MPVVDLGVGGDDRDQVGGRDLGIEVHRLEPEFLQRWNVRVVVGDVAPEGAEHPDDLQRRCLAGVPDPGLVADAEDQDAGPVDRFAYTVQRLLDPVDAELRLSLVDLPGQLDELRVEVELARLEGEVEGVHGQAVSTHPGPGLEAHEPERLGRGAVDHLPDVDPQPLAELRELVHQGDVDRAEDVLQQLRELRRLGCGENDDLLADQRVELACALRGGLVQPTHHLRCRPHGEVRAAGVDPLGRERQVEVAARRHPRLLEDRQQTLPGGARVGGRLQDDQLLGLEHLRERRRGVQEEGEVGLAGPGERGRDADDHGVTGGEVGVGGGRLEQIAAGLEDRVGDVLDVAAATAQALDLGLVGVESDDLVPGLGEGDRQRQADVSEADDPYLHGSHSRTTAENLRNRVPKYRKPANCALAPFGCSDLPNRIGADEEDLLAGYQRHQRGPSSRLVFRLSRRQVASRALTLSAGTDA